MYIKNKYVSLIYKILIVIIGVYGLYSACFFNNVSLSEHFAYYTNLSNLLCILYYLVLVIKIILTKSTNYNPMIKGALTIVITITAIVYNFVLRPFMTDMEGIMDLHSISNYIVHIIIPLMVILDWLLFDSKGLHKKYYVFIWLILPFLYWIFICIRAHFGSSFAYTSSRYPYYFLDIDAYGINQVLLNVFIVILAVLILGLLYIKLDNKLIKK